MHISNWIKFSAWIQREDKVALHLFVPVTDFLSVTSEHVLLWQGQGSSAEDGLLGFYTM
jgi:hypothetical protein